MFDHCDYDAAIRAVEEVVDRLVSEHYEGVPRAELEILKNFAVNDLVHYFATRAGVYSRERFSEEGARRLLCAFIERARHKLWDIVSEWFVLWKIKWNQRVKLVFSDKELKQRARAERPERVNISRVLGRERLRELKLFIIASLIRSGEVAGVEQIAEFLVHDELGNLLNSHGAREVIRMYTSGELAYRLLERVDALRRVSGPLLLLKFDFRRVR
jgi:hypothetical protein